MVIINTTRSEYSPKNVSTMTVGELIKELQTNYSSSDKVCLSFDEGYSFGGITADCIEEKDEREFEEYV